MPTNDPTQHGPWGIYDQPALAAPDTTRERVAAVLCRVMDHGDHPFGCPESLDAAPELIAAADAAPLTVGTDAHHHVTITFEEGYPSYRFTCTAPADALCRADWSCDCEQFYDEQVRNGVPAHRPHWRDSDTWHAGVFKADFCGIKAWFDGSSENPLDGEITVPVDAEWDGEYYAFTAYTPATLDVAPVTGGEFAAAVIAERATHASRGYDAAHDAEQGVERLLTWAMDYAQRGEHIKSWAIVQAARELLARPAPITVKTVEEARALDPERFPACMAEDSEVYRTVDVQAYGGLLDYQCFPATVLAPATPERTEQEREATVERAARAADALRPWLLGLGTLTLGQVNDLAPKFARAAIAAFEGREATS